MTNRFNALTVVLDKEIREDDAEHLIGAIRMLKGVLSVSGNVTDVGVHIAYEKAKREISDKLWEVIYPK